MQHLKRIFKNYWEKFRDIVRELRDLIVAQFSDGAPHTFLELSSIEELFWWGLYATVNYNTFVWWGKMYRKYVW